MHWHDLSFMWVSLEITLWAYLLIDPAWCLFVHCFFTEPVLLFPGLACHLIIPSNLTLPKSEHITTISIAYKVGEKGERPPSQARHPVLRPPAVESDARILSSNWGRFSFEFSLFSTSLQSSTSCSSLSLPITSPFILLQLLGEHVDQAPLHLHPLLLKLWNLLLHNLQVLFSSFLQPFLEIKNASTWQIDTHALYLTETRHICCHKISNVQNSSNFLATCSISRDSASMSAL